MWTRFVLGHKQGVSIARESPINNQAGWEILSGFQVQSTPFTLSNTRQLNDKIFVILQMKIIARKLGFCKIKPALEWNGIMEIGPLEESA